MTRGDYPIRVSARHKRKRMPVRRPNQLPGGLRECRGAHSRGRDGRIEAERSRLGIIEPVSIDDRFTIVAKCLANQLAQFLNSHGIGIGMVESIHKFVEIGPGNQRTFADNVGAPGSTDDGEEHGRRQSVPSRALQRFHEERAGAGAFSSSPPPRRRRDDQPESSVAPSPAIWLSLAPPS